MASTEALIVAAIVDDGAAALRKVYAAGLSAESFVVYQDEFQWIEQRLSRKRPLNRRTFMDKFGADFEWLTTKESVEDLAVELKEEVALGEMNAMMSVLADGTTKDNVIERLMMVRDQLNQTLRAHAPMSDVDLDEYESVIEEMKQGMILAKQGESLGILTGINFLDHHWGGLMPGQYIEVLGRTGAGKSMFAMLLAWAARKRGHRVGIFSPEMSAHEVRCRYHTIASADKDVQREVGLERSFRNRALMHRHGFNLKSFQTFCEYVRDMPGALHLLCGSGMKDQMSVGYVEDRIVEHELDLVIVDPIYLLRPVRTHRDGNVYQEVAWIAESLHRIGEQYDVPIVFTNQAHLDGNKGDAPGLDKSFGSKALLHLADYVLGVMHMSEENLLVVKSNKSRFGAGFRFQATFVANTGYFEVTTPLGHSYMNGTDDEAEEVVKHAVKGR